MHDICGKFVDRLLIYGSKKWSFVSPVAAAFARPLRMHGAKAAFVPTPIHIKHPYISPRKIAGIPLGEHYFYPVSTAPITTSTKGN